MVSDTSWCEPSGADLRPYMAKGMRVLDSRGKTVVTVSSGVSESKKVVERIVLLLNGGAVPMRVGNVKSEPGRRAGVFASLHGIN